MTFCRALLPAFALAIFGLTATPQPAQAQLLVDATNPDAVAEVLREMGYRALVEQHSSTGNPVIRTAAEGVNYSIYFYGCVEMKDCRSIQYFVSLKLTSPPGQAKINEWNANRTIGQAYSFDESSVALKQFYPMAGGVSREALQAGSSLWIRAMGEYLTFTGFR